MLTVTSIAPDTVQMTLPRNVTGRDVVMFGDALEIACRDYDGTVVIHLTEVRDWSLLAQAMVLSTARLLASRGGRLLLAGPSDELRRRSTTLDIFNRVETLP
jgi:anti-anti-sigma regulatory factor